MLYDAAFRSDHAPSGGNASRTWLECICDDSDPACCGLRERVEAWYAAAPSNLQDRVCDHLRRENDNPFLSHLYELAVAEYLRSRNWQLEYEPRGYMKPPDFAAHADGILVTMEVASLFDSEEETKEYRVLSAPTQGTGRLRRGKVPGDKILTKLRDKGKDFQPECQSPQILVACRGVWLWPQQPFQLGAALRGFIDPYPDLRAGRDVTTQDRDGFFFEPPEGEPDAPPCWGRISAVMWFDLIRTHDAFDIVAALFPNPNAAIPLGDGLFSDIPRFGCDELDAISSANWETVAGRIL
jgi:hypothetical protein